MNVKLSNTLLATALGFALAGTAVAETIVIEEPQVRTIVTRAGYAEPVTVVRDSDLWRVTSTKAGEDVTVFVDANGKLLGAADVNRTRIVSTTTVADARVVATPLDEAAVTTVLVDAGFHNVHDVDRNGEVWKAEADDITGEDFEIHVNARTGRIVHIEDD